MAVEGGESAAAVKPMRIQMPEPRFESIVQADHEESSPEETDADTGNDMLGEDAQSVVGFSISKAQSRLSSPRTPAAEKAAAIAYIDGGLFDGEIDKRPETRQVPEVQKDFPPDSEEGGTEPTTPNYNNKQKELPSPWKAAPQTFELSRTDMQHHQPSASTSIFSDGSFKRYLSNLNLPLMPRTTTFKDMSVPSFSSILSNARSRSPLCKDSTRQKRASTYVTPTSSSKSRNHFELSPADSRRRRSDTLPAEATNEGKINTGASILAQGGVERAVKGHQRAISDVANVPPQKPRLRRSTSDQSLLLRRATSTVSTLGDDSRWENVQEQVNSRMKAIMDSLQDSSIKLPSMPNLSSLNLGSFRPDFTRSRAHSEAKRPVHISNGQRQIENSTDGNNHLNLNGIPYLSSSEAHPAGRKGSKSALSYLEDALKNLTGDLVVMGGYRGSILRSAQPPHRQLWVPVKVGLNIRRVNLEIGLDPEDEENMEKQIFASGMLSHIGPVDMGRRLLKRLRACRNVQEGRLRVHDYGYDWRLSPHLLSRRLVAFLENLQCNAPGAPGNERGATILAHSMGGLITRHAVNQRPDLFAGVVYAGVPQHCVNILGPLRNGDEVLLSSKVLTAQVNFTLRSSYLLLPEDGKCFINKETKEEYKVNFFDVEHWKRYAWSPCIAPALPPINSTEKTLFGSVSDLLPSLPSLPLPGKKASVSRSGDDQSNFSHAAHTASAKLQDLADPTTTRALDPQLSQSCGPVSNSNGLESTIPLRDALAYLDRTLNEILVFKSQLAHDPCYSVGNLYPPLAIIYATNTPTVVAARVSSREAISHADAYDDLQFASGDGVCLAKAAMLPEGYECAKGGRVRTERGHVGLLGDLEAVGRCLLAVIHARRRGAGLGVEAKSATQIQS